METFLGIDLNVSAIIMISIILVSSWNRLDRLDNTNRYLIAFLASVAVQNLIDIFAWVFNGLPGPQMILMNRIGNSLLFIGNPIPPILWIMYTQSLIFHDPRRLNRWWRSLSAIIVANAAFIALSWQTGWVFSISADNKYIRGPWVQAHTALSFVLIVLSIIQIIKHKERLKYRLYGLILAYYLLPIVGVILQMTYYGLNLIWPSAALSALFVFQNIQDNHLTTDFLTGTYNRPYFERLIAKKINLKQNDQKIAVVAADIDHLKQINDNFGHFVGDQALQITVEILRQCIRPNDIIARMGGDEFYIVIKLDGHTDLPQRIARFEEAFARFNGKKAWPFTLAVSLGGIVFDRSVHFKSWVLLEAADQMLVQEKNRRSNQQRNSDLIAAGATPGR